MAITHMPDGTILKSHKPERNLTMPTLCAKASHIWTVEASTTTLMPALDLVPGRRCRCGCFVILDADTPATPGVLFPIAKINSLAAEHWARRNPALVTW